MRRKKWRQREKAAIINQLAKAGESVSWLAAQPESPHREIAIAEMAWSIVIISAVGAAQPQCWLSCWPSAARPAGRGAKARG
jgi:hypothetical protein